jgi:hypothetical protein
LLDFQLAELYGVTTKALNQAVKRNRERFPEDFMFQLSREEVEQVMHWAAGSSAGQWSASSLSGEDAGEADRAENRSQIVTGSQKHRDPRRSPYAFTEQGVAMLSSVLRSPRAVLVNIAIMRAFVQLRRLLGGHEELARKLAALEAKYDRQFKVVFDAIRALMREPPAPRREIGFHTMLPRPGKAEDRRAKTGSPPMSPRFREP